MAAPSSVVPASPEPSTPAPTTPPPAESSNPGDGTTEPPTQAPTTAPPAVTSDPGTGGGGGAVPSSNGGADPTGGNGGGAVPSGGASDPAPGGGGGGAGGSDAAVPTSNGGGAAGGGAGAGSASPTRSAGEAAKPTQWTTVYETITGADGTVQTSAIVSQLPSGSGGSSTNVGAIVGGVVGGVGGAIVLAVLLWFFIRKRRNYRDDFDDLMFDPSRAQNHAPVDLGDDEGMPTIDPYGYNSGAGIASTATTPITPEMTQAHGGHSGYAPVSQDYAQTPTTPGFAGRGAGSPVYPSDSNNLYADNANLYPQPLSPQPTSVGDHSAGTYSTATYSTGDHSAGAYGAAGGAAAAAGAAAAPMSAKQREALQESQRFHVQNQSQAYGGPGPSAWSSEPQGVTVHQDGGAWNEAEASGAEIPPTYDSIPRGQR